MTYLEQLHPWCIVRQLPNNRIIVVGRFRHYNDAIAHLQILQRLLKHQAFRLSFEIKTEPN